MRKKLLLLSALLAFSSNLGLAQDLGRFVLGKSEINDTQLRAGKSELRAEDDKLRVGYATDRVDRSFTLQMHGGPIDYGAAVLLKGDILNKYVGNKLTDIVFYHASSPSTMGSMRVFVTKDLHADPATYMHSQTVPDVKVDSWNTIALNREITIEKDTPLYIGMVASYSNAFMPVVKACYERGFRESNANFFLDRSTWSPFDRFGDETDYNFPVYAYIKGSNVPLNDVGIRRLDASDFVRQNTPSEAFFLMRNYSRDNVKKVTLSAKSGGVEFQKLIVDNIDVPTGLEMRINMKGIRYPKEGNHKIDFSVLSVNGGEDKDVKDNMLPKHVFVLKEGRELMPKKVLFEQFTAESHHSMPVADSLYAISINKSKDAVWIKHHIYEDAYALPYVDAYKLFFEGGRTFLPAIAVNRDIYPYFDVEKGPAYFLNSESFVDRIIRLGLSFPATISVKGKVKLNQDTNVLDVTIEGESAANELPFTKDPHLTVMLVEDSIKSTTQTGKAEYIQNGVVRAVLSSSAWGDRLDVSNYTYRKDFSIKLKDEWNKQHLRIVAFVNNYGGKYDQLRVHNVDEFKVMSSDSSDGLLPMAEPKVWYASDAVQVPEGFDIVAVYNLAGLRFSPEHLAAGQYVVQISNGRTATAHRLLVK